MNTKHTLLIDCNDAKGLIYKITDLIYRFSINIVLNREYVDSDSNHFFMRSILEGKVNDEELISALKEILPVDSKITLVPNQKKKVVILATKEHPVLGDLLIKHEFGELNIDIQAVISNHDVLQPFVEKFDIPFHHISHEQLSRENHEQKVSSVINDYDPDFIVLAKYMRILNPEFVAPFRNRIINIHHSFLPAFIGARPYHQAHQRGVKIIGATAHFVNESLDEGPIITQATRPINHTHNVSDMVHLGKETESRVLSEALSLVCDHKVFVHDHKTVILD